MLHIKIFFKEKIEEIKHVTVTVVYQTCIACLLKKKKHPCPLSLHTCTTHVVVINAHVEL